ncbi:hypothetical protein BH09PSE5_BH09PSE5_30230 [soil metagenome]
MRVMITTLAFAAAAFCLSATETLAADAAASAPKQQTKMAMCNKDAVGKKGDERKAFMKQCLSGKAAGSATAMEAPTASDDRTKSCKADAKGMRGNARKDFLKECMAKAA